MKPEIFHHLTIACADLALMGYAIQARQEVWPLVWLCLAALNFVLFGMDIARIA